MIPPGIWVSKCENGRWDEPMWLNIGREWYLELRTQLRSAWLARYGRTLPLGVSPKAWVLVELKERGVRMRGEEAIHLPYVLYLKVRLAEGGDSRKPEGPWKVLESIVPRPSSKRAGFFNKLFRRKGP